MANSYLTISMIGYAMLPVLHNNTVAARKVSRKYESQFAKTGAKIGDTFMVRKPPRYVVTQGQTFIGQDYTDERVPLVVDQHNQIGVEFADDDLTLSMDDFIGRVLDPQLVPMANAVDVFIMSKFAQVWNATGTPGTPPATDTPYLDAKTLLGNNAAADNEEWPMLVTLKVDARLSSGLAGRFNPQATISKLYDKGSMGPALGWMFYHTQNMPTHVTGAWAANVPATGILVDGANQTGASILLKGAATTVTGMGKAGDVIQFDGVFMLNPITKANIGELQNFVLTADCDSSGGGALTVLISPPIILGAGNKDATVSASPADSAQVFVWGTATVANIASKTSPQMMGWSSDGITLAMVDLAKFPKNTGVEQVTVHDDDLGLAISFTRGTDIREFSLISRVDSLYGTSYTRPEHVVRIAG